MENKKVLIVEDEPEIARTLVEKLLREGIESVVASDGEEALSQLKKEQFSLILLDLLMPRMNGFEFLKINTHKEIPIIILTNLSDETKLQGALDLGAQKYLIKADTEISQVVESVKNIL